MAVSYCHHSRLFKGHNFKGDISGFVNDFVNDTLLFSQYWTHLKEAWTKRGHPNLLYLFYEDMKADPRATIIKIKDFLGATLTEDQIKNVLNHTCFEAMKSREEEAVTGPDSDEYYNLEVREMEGGFFRKGVAGDWKTNLTSEDIEKIEKWTEKRTQEFDGEFKYKLS